MISDNVTLNPAHWLDKHGDYLYRYALIRVRNSGIAEDLLQETLLAAIRSSHNYVGRSSERTWLVGIMKHKVVDYFRRVAHAPQFQASTRSDDDEVDWFEKSGPRQGQWREDEAPLNWCVNASDLLESSEFWETFDRCLSRLPKQLGIAFTLREIDGLNASEICEILQITPNNLWVMLHRARAKLRNLLESEWFHASSLRDQKSLKPGAGEATTETRVSYRAAAA